eukprot:m.1211835 g.1211835  ORF g.1211835 m.1211835 type:complete len:76 (+) comp24596_c0_seq2:4403-4630(+)
MCTHTATTKARLPEGASEHNRQRTRHEVCSWSVHTFTAPATRVSARQTPDAGWWACTTIWVSRIRLWAQRQRTNG